MKKRTIHIRDNETHEIVRTIKTEFRGSQYDKLVLGLLRKTDLERFYVDEVDEVEEEVEAR